MKWFVRGSTSLLSVILGLVLFFNPFSPILRFSDAQAPGTHNISERIETPQKQVVLLEFEAIITGYSSTFEETDSTPYITASNKVVGQGIIACPINFPFGTMVLIKNKEYRCEDRMAYRFRNGDHFDIWFSSKKEAKEFGRQKLIVSIFEYLVN